MALVLRGVVATLAAMAATALLAALARAAGVDLEVDGGERVPVSGIATVTGFFSLVGVVLAVALRRWSTRPVSHFVWITVTLTALSLVPPLLYAADAATTLTLVVLHLVAAGVVVPSLARALRS